MIPKQHHGVADANDKKEFSQDGGVSSRVAGPFLSLTFEPWIRTGGGSHSVALPTATGAYHEERVLQNDLVDEGRV